MYNGISREREKGRERSASMFSDHLMFYLTFFSFLLLPSHDRKSTLAGASQPPCSEKCGVMDIPYPFGIKEGCFLPGFQLACDHSITPPFAVIHNTTIQVLSFDVSSAQIRVNSTPNVAHDCINKTTVGAGILLPETGPFFISAAGNKFTAIGCDTTAVVVTSDIEDASGCISLCSSKSNVTSGACDGVGCCQSQIPKGKRSLGFATSPVFKYANVTRYDKCSYSFIVEEGGYTFKDSDLMKFHPKNLSVVLDWGIGEVGCKNLSGKNVCGDDLAYCLDSSNATGYVCRCREGYAGNPYVNGGCKDIDECKDPQSDRCAPGARCLNRDPGYECSCPAWTVGDAAKGASGCRKIAPIVISIIGTTSCLMFIFVAGIWFYCMSRKRRMAKLKEDYFTKNGGLLLSQHEASNHSRIFSEDELLKATNNYHESRILGTGGYGTVYKGILQDRTVVAVKRSKIMDKTQIDQFINEVIILTQINHRNVVKLLGCCLETEVPLLVYEFISNGTLHHHIHEGDTPNIKISWENRVRIATETAEALAYLHSSTSMPIYHRDVKLANILLDDSFTAKVSDFGASRLVPMDQTQLSTLVQGTLGYLDPEYFQSGQLTEKSDVYSFGVVLTELLTGEKPVSFERQKESSNIAVYFLQKMKINKVDEILDKNISIQGNTEEILAVAELAKRCLQLQGEQRPTMKEVARELESIRANKKQHPWIEHESDGCKNETEDVYLLQRQTRASSSGQESTGSVTVSMPIAPQLIQPFAR